MGENGSGKSILIEAITCAIGTIIVGSESVKTDPTLKEVNRFSKTMHLTWDKRTHRGFFVRAPDYFGYIKNLSKTRAELEGNLSKVEKN